MHNEALQGEIKALFERFPELPENIASGMEISTEALLKALFP